MIFQRANEWLDQAIASGDAVVNEDGTVTVQLAPEVVQAIRAMAQGQE
ncbi:hypothetical protein [Streptomyces turgidiscabies]